MNDQLKKELIYILAFLGFVSFIGWDIQRGKFQELEPKEVQAIETTPTPPSSISPKSGQTEAYITTKGEEGVENEEIKKMVYDTFGDDGNVAYAVAKAESTLQTNKCHIDEKEYSCGLFQINLRAHFNKVPGETFEDKAEWLKNPYNNILIAKFIHGSSGFRPWTMFVNGVYKNFL